MGPLGPFSTTWQPVTHSEPAAHHGLPPQPRIALASRTESRLVTPCPDSSRLAPLGLREGRDTHPHQAESMSRSTMPCAPTRRFTKVPNSSFMNSGCGDQSHHKFASEIGLVYIPWTQQGEPKLRLLDPPIPDLAWLLLSQPSKVRLDSTSKLPTSQTHL